jgi:hypothetical protein
VECGGVCVDLQSDVGHCGACYNACMGVAPPGQSSFGKCVNGVCRVVCESGYSVCLVGGIESCVDMRTDEQHCGACDKPCAPGEPCLDGNCGGARPSPTARPETDKWSLWTRRSQLRGAYVLQRRVDADLDDPLLGVGPTGPLYEAGDFERLARLRANYVEIAHPVPLTERSPYRQDRDLEEHLSALVDQAAAAGLFVVIGFWSGPGRAEQALDPDVVCLSGGCLVAPTGDGATELWDEPDMQEGWEEAWRATADRYRGHPAVIGYDLMVAPDVPDLTAWERFARSLTDAIRDVDAETPVLVSLPRDDVDLGDFRPTGDERTVYRHNLLPPARYFEQDPEERGSLTYPGRFDEELDGFEGRFDHDWIEGRVAALREFAERQDARIAIGAYAVSRSQPGSIDYLSDVLASLESAHLNHGLWVWHPGDWEGEDELNLEYGTDPRQHDAEPNELLDLVAATWRKNRAKLDEA